MRHHLATAVVLAAMTALPAAAVAQEATTTAQQQLPETDLQFAQQAAIDNIAEIDLGEMAVDKAANQAVKDFGQRMVDDHTRAQDQLERIAEDKGFELATETPADKQQMHDQLDALSEAEFDRAYMDHMVTDHEKAVELFQNQADSGQDSELKQFAEQTLPILQQHLEQAQQIQAQMSEMAGAGGESPEGMEPAAGAAGTAAGVGAATDADDLTATQQAAVPQGAFGQMTADELIGSRVVNQSGEKVGELTDIVINQQDQAVIGVISVGGFLGLGEKQVAVPFEQLQPGEDETVLMSTATEDELKEMPAYEENEEGFEPFPRDQPLSGSAQ